MTRKKTLKNTDTWKLNSMLLNNQWATEEIKEEVRKYPETSENESTTVQNQCDVAKAMLRGKCIAPQSFLRKQGKSQVNNLASPLRQLEKEEQKAPKISRRKEIIKIQVEISEKEMKETLVKINRIKTWFFEKINKIDKLLARLIKRKR